MTPIACLSMEEFLCCSLRQICHLWFWAIYTVYNIVYTYTEYDLTSWASKTLVCFIYSLQFHFCICLIKLYFASFYFLWRLSVVYSLQYMWCFGMKMVNFKEYCSKNICYKLQKPLRPYWSNHSKYSHIGRHVLYVCLWAHFGSTSVPTPQVSPLLPNHLWAKK